jgi:hypothetical protein
VRLATSRLPQYGFVLRHDKFGGVVIVDLNEDSSIRGRPSRAGEASHD